MTLITQSILMFFASLGFSMLFDTQLKFLPICAFFGALVHSAMYTATYYFNDIFICSLISAIIAATVSEISARRLKAPKTVFLLPSIIPLVPGSTLFSAASAIIGNDIENAELFIWQTIDYTLGISAGILIISLLFRLKPRV